MRLNTIVKTDVMEGMKLLPDKSIDIIITSPPYNKAGLNGIRADSPKKNWKANIVYGGDMSIDCKPEDEYQRWQIDFLNECERVLKDDGSLFYNHKNRIHKGFIVSPDTILACIPNEGEDKIVLDPFMGSGTVAISAIKHNFRWLGFELLDEYVDMANNRIRNFYDENYSNGIAYGNCFPIDIP